MDIQAHIKRLFSLYNRKEVSTRTRKLFGGWLRSPHLQQEKDAFLQKLWEQTEAKAGAETATDWTRLRPLLQSPTLSTYSWLRKSIQYAAAAIILIVCSISGTYWFMHSETEPIQTEMIEYFHPGGKAKEIVLADNSRIWVKGGSLLIYPKDFTHSDKRTVYLSGEASFQVSKNKEKPFTVKTANMDVEVLGTIFNVEAYPEDSLTTTTLEEGSVRINLKDAQQSSALLKPHEQLVYSNRTQKSKIQMVDISSYEMERQGFLVFENASFKQIVSALEREYQVTIRCAFTPNEEEQYKLRFSPDESLEEALQIFCRLTGVNYRKSGDVIILS